MWRPITRVLRALLRPAQVLDRGDIRFFGNVEYGKDLSLADLREHYDAIIFATGAIHDAPLPIKGIDLDGSYGAADFRLVV